MSTPIKTSLIKEAVKHYPEVDAGDLVELRLEDGKSAYYQVFYTPNVGFRLLELNTGVIRTVLSLWGEGENCIDPGKVRKLNPGEKIQLEVS